MRYLSPGLLKQGWKENMNQNQPSTRCSRCGAELPPHLPSGLCPKCLLEAGLGTQPQTGPDDTVVFASIPRA